MIDLKRHLAVQAYCFRHFKDGGPVAIARKVREIGLTKVEISPPADRALFQTTIQQFQDEGVGIASVFAPTLTGNEPAERSACEFAQLCGLKHMTVNFALDQNVFKTFALAEKLAAEYDLNLGIHNHGCAHWLGSAAVLDYVFQNTSPRIGLCLDTAWAQDANLNAVDAVRKYARRLYGVHFKDFVYTPAKKHRDVVIGAGTIDLPALCQALRDIDYQGFAALEYEGEPENPNTALIACRQAVELCC
jgi:sugar phosphate isomerase/epimerase